MGRDAYILIGRPLAGKDTVAEYLVENVHGLHYVSSGNLVAAVRKNPGHPFHAKFMEQPGLLVPDQMLFEMLEAEFASLPPGPIVLNGLPRRESQVPFVARYVQPKAIYHLTNVEVPVLFGRMLRRFQEQQRVDDTPERFYSRQAEYEALTLPVLEHYKGVVPIVTVDTSGPEGVACRFVKEDLEKRLTCSA